MATCNDILAELKNLPSPASYSAQAKGLYENVRAANTVEQLNALAQQANDGLANLQTVFWQKWKSLSTAATEQKCKDAIALAESLRITWLNVGNEFRSAFNFTQSKKSDIEAAAQKSQAESAAAKENNQGTGTPGTAGQGAGATPGASSPPTQIAAGASGATGATTASAGPKPVTPTGGATGASGATTASTAPGATGPKPVTPTGGATGASGATGSAAPAAGNAAPYATDTNKGLSGAVDNTQSQANRQDAANYALEGDWRVRLALAPGAQYLYDLPDNQASGILAPLRATDGVIFPYTPNINITYAAQYEPAEVTHSNYKIWQYRNSSVDNVTITADFTAQDTHEANYLLAVIHFFRTVTKMFYGKDQDPKAGTPPPLCYLYGLGQFQFNMHPLLITNFTYVLPNDVDYIRATTNITTAPLVNKSSGNTPNDTNNPSNERISSSPSSVSAGGVPNKPTYSTTSSGTVTPTYVPTKITVTIQAIPVVARNDISQSFSLKDYATGKLLVGKDRPGRGGVW